MRKINIKGIVAGLSSELIIFVMTLLWSILIIPLYLIYISLSEYGEYVLLQSLLLLFSIFDVSLTLYATKRLSAWKMSSKKKSDVLITSFQIYQLILAVFLFFLGVVLSKFLLFYIFNEHNNSGEILKTFYYLWASFCIGIGFGINHSILRAKEDFLLINFIIFSTLVLTNLFALYFLALGFGVISFGYGSIISIIVSNMLVYAIVLYKYGINIFSWGYPSKQLLYLSVPFAIKTNFLKIGAVFRNSGFMVMLGMLASTEMLALYNLANKFPQLIPNLLTKLTGLLFPQFSSHFALHQFDEINSKIQTLTSILIKTVTIFGLFTIFYINDVLEAWLGQTLELSLGLVFVVAYRMSIQSLYALNLQVINASGKFYKYELIVICEVLSSVVFGFFGYHLAGIFGFFMGSLIPMTLSVVMSYIIVNFSLNRNSFYQNYKLDFVFLLSATGVNWVLFQIHINLEIQFISFAFAILVNSLLLLIVLADLRGIKWR